MGHLLLKEKYKALVRIMVFKYFVSPQRYRESQTEATGSWRVGIPERPFLSACAVATPAIPSPLPVHMRTDVVAISHWFRYRTRSNKAEPGYRSLMSLTVIEIIVLSDRGRLFFLVFLS